MISSDSLLAGHRNSNISFPTVSVDSFLGAARCFFVTESAWGWMLSRRWREMVTIEMLTGLDMPTAGRISTVPSIRGYHCQNVSQSAFNGLRTHQRGRDSWVSN